MLNQFNYIKDNKKQSRFLGVTATVVENHYEKDLLRLDNLRYLLNDSADSLAFLTEGFS